MHQNGHTMKEPLARVIWIAVAFARGHLMRAALMQRVLGERGIKVDIVTTSKEGLAFLKELGTTAELMSSGFEIQYDERQNIQHRATQLGVIRYAVDPTQGASDIAMFRRMAKGADLIVNDIHPFGLIFPKTLGGKVPMVQLYGENMWGALEGYPRGLFPDWFAELYARLVRGQRDGSFGRVEHALEAPLQGAWRAKDQTWLMPPIISKPTRSRDEVRAALGVPEGKRLVVAYTNPHFAAPELAGAIERAVASVGAQLYAVGEGFGEREAWHFVDPELVDKLAAADVVVSAAGMGVLGQVRAFDRPFLGIRTDQPEQQLNLEILARLEDHEAPVEVVHISEDEELLAGAFTTALTELLDQEAERAKRATMERAHAGASVTQKAWADALTALVHRAQALGRMSWAERVALEWGRSG
ncbi:MAG: hypothetical protein AAGI01_08495 [Myxococcota bacterium]